MIIVFKVVLKIKMLNVFYNYITIFMLALIFKLSSFKNDSNLDQFCSNLSTIGGVSLAHNNAKVQKINLFQQILFGKNWTRCWRWQVDSVS